MKNCAIRSLAIEPISPRCCSRGGWSGRREAPGPRGRVSPTGLVSSRPPSIRACGSPAHGSPTFFTYPDPDLPRQATTSLLPPNCPRDIAKARDPPIDQCSGCPIRHG